MKYYNFKITSEYTYQDNSNLELETFKRFETGDYLLVGEFRLFSSSFEPLVFIENLLRNKHYLNKVDGEYSFVLFNKTNKTIYLARDPMGIKNIYYSLENNALKVSSNIFNLISLKDSKKFSIKGVTQYLLYEFLNDPCTLFDNVWSVVRGELITIDIGELKIVSKKLFRKKLGEISENDNDDKDSLASTLREKITNAHSKRVESHNTILLSGGIDSTVMAVALQKDLGIKNLSAVTFDTKNAEFSEVNYAKDVAKRMGIKHTVIEVDPFNNDVDIFDIIDRSNFSYMGSMFLDSIMKSEVFSGQDNFFAGQDTRLHTPALNQFDTLYFKYFNSSLVNDIISNTSAGAISLFDINGGKLGKVLKRGQFFNKKDEYILQNLFHMHRDSILFDSQSVENTTAELTAIFQHIPTDLRRFYNTVIDTAWSWQYTDDIAYMSNNFSENNHTTSMPFYDQALAEYSASIPMSFALRQTKGKAGYGGKTKFVNKYILREAYKDDLSHELIYRDKAVALTNHIYLNTIMSSYIKDFFVNSKLKSTEVYAELGLSRLMKIALENNGKWKVEDYLTVVEVQNLLFLEIIARKYDIND